MKCLLFIFLGATAIAGFASPNSDFAAGLEARENGFWEVALDRFGRAAREGHVAAHYYAGLAYDNGQGTNPDAARAFAFFKIAAEKGYPKAQFMLWRKMIYGHGTVKDLEGAMVWLDKSAEGGYGIAQFTLADSYANGVGVEMDLLKAWRLFSRALNTLESEAIESDSPEALHGLGMMHLKGLAVDRQLYKALFYLERAAQLGYRPAMIQLWKQYYYGAGIPYNFERANMWHKIVTSQLRANERDPGVLEMVRKHRDKSGEDYVNGILGKAEDGDPEAQFELAMFFRQGHHVDVDYGEALFWLQKASRQEHPQAQYALYNMLAKGEGVPPNLKVANEWLALAARSNYAPAQLELGKNFFEGHGVPRHYRYANSLIVLAARAGMIDVAPYMASLTLHGLGGAPKDPAMAYNWYKIAATRGHVQSMVDLAEMAYRGRGVPQDFDLAHEWTLEAAYRKHTEAQMQLASWYLDGRELAVDQGSAIRWYRRAFSLGHKDALLALARTALYGQNRETNNERLAFYQEQIKEKHHEYIWYLAEMYRDGDGVERDLDQFFSLAVKAAAYEHPDAAYSLYTRFLDNKDEAAAESWLLKAADWGQADAMAKVGRRLLIAPPEKRDIKKAEQWLRRALLGGSVEARFDLGYMYEHGIGVVENAVQAARLYRGAALRGNRLAMYQLGVCFEQGIGVAVDTKEARAWYRRAAEEALPRAVDALARLAAGPGE